MGNVACVRHIAPQSKPGHYPGSGLLSLTRLCTGEGRNVYVTYSLMNVDSTQCVQYDPFQSHCPLTELHCRRDSEACNRRAYF